MSQKQLEILIKKGIENAETTQTPTNREETPRRKNETSTTKKATQAHLIGVAKRAINLGISKSGDLTGNYEIARKANNALALAGVIGTFVATGPVLGTVIVGGQALLESATAGIDLYVEKRSLEYNNQRLGRISRPGRG